MEVEVYQPICRRIDMSMVPSHHSFHTHTPLSASIPVLTLFLCDSQWNDWYPLLQPMCKEGLWSLPGIHNKGFHSFQVYISFMKQIIRAEYSWSSSCVSPDKLRSEIWDLSSVA
jgi:hypothetical protein